MMLNTVQTMPRKRVVLQRSLVLLPLLAIASVALVLVSGPNDKPPPYERLTPAVIKPGSTIPAPSGVPILTVSGAIKTTNADDKLVLDLETLEAFGLAEYTVRDPWLERDIRYTGILMADFLEVTGVEPSATELHMVALNDYLVDISLADLQTWPVLLATQADGKHIAIRDGGPSRIILPSHLHPELGQVRYHDLWIWNIATIEVR